jgi:hypothetical protein
VEPLLKHLVVEELVLQAKIAEALFTQQNNRRTNTCFPRYFNVGNVIIRGCKWNEAIMRNVTLCDY